jgi:hypothetical protein
MIDALILPDHGNRVVRERFFAPRLRFKTYDEPNA